LQHQPGGPARQWACSQVIVLMCELCGRRIEGNSRCDSIVASTKSTRITAERRQENSKCRTWTLRTDGQI